MSGQAPLRIRRSVALASAICALSTACATPIAVDLEEKDANQVVATLESRGIAAEKTLAPGGDSEWSVEVGRADSSRAVAVLSEENLPRTRTGGLVETLNQGSLVPSRAAEHARLLRGSATELERSLESVDGIVAARVHLAVARRDPLEASARGDGSASVLLKFQGARPALAEEDVKRLVAGAVPGLSPEHVTVVTTRSAPPATSADVARFGPVSTTRAALPRLRLGVAIAALLNIALVGLVVTLWLRQRSARQLAATRRPLATDER